ncbi:hypothetical protein NT05HA_1863 [Aggregatibacter aphrophilus NJ8700]|nr:hypothetical protein NT05HA_1863 [Aggregatibacter aphrophilus NJ8700]
MKVRLIWGEKMFCREIDKIQQNQPYFFSLLRYAFYFYVYLKIT